MKLTDMANDKPNLLCITPVKHIKGVCQGLEDIANVKYLDDPSLEDVCKESDWVEIIYTNPNKSDVYLGENVFNACKNLKIITTASTGTVHIDKNAAAARTIEILSLTKEIEIIEKISSTAEHSFALMLSALRRIPGAFKSVLHDEWNYEPYIGRQLNTLTLGVIGYGRLGTMMARYGKAFGMDVLVHDPYKSVPNDLYRIANSLEDLYEQSDIISLHVHVTEETTNLINNNSLQKMKENVLIVNTARGEIVDETALVDFLQKNPKAMYATDVINGEIHGKDGNAIIQYAQDTFTDYQTQVVITPHIAGMTQEAQEIAYNHAVKLLHDFLSQ